MTEKEQQAATDQTEGTPPGDSDQTGAREKSLDDLLAEWDQPKEEPKGDPKPKPEDDRVAALERRIAQQDYEREMSRVIDSVKGDLNAEDEFVEYWVNKRAEQDQRLQKLWNERDSRRKEWNNAVSAMSREFQQYWKERFSGNDTRRQISAAAMASGSTQTGGHDDRIRDELASMNDRDFILKKSEIFRNYGK